MDFVNSWSRKTGIAVCCMLLWIGLGRSKWHDWKKRYGKVNEHHAWIPRDPWLEETEKKAGAYRKIFNPRWSLFA